MSQYSSLIKEAFKAREFSYAPYSNFNVGAALLTNTGEIYKGCNIENASYTPTCCAERTAFFKAISEGEKNFKAIAIVGALNGTEVGEYEYCSPCGVCRQVMVEFCDLNKFDVVLARDINDYKIYNLNDLLPLSFTGKDIVE